MKQLYLDTDISHRLELQHVATHNNIQQQGPICVQAPCNVCHAQDLTWQFNSTLIYHTFPTQTLNSHMESKLWSLFQLFILIFCKMYHAHEKKHDTFQTRAKFQTRRWNKASEGYSQSENISVSTNPKFQQWSSAVFSEMQHPSGLLDTKRADLSQATHQLQTPLEFLS